MIIEKTCSRCGATHPATTEFFPERSKRPGLSSWCRECYRLKSRAWSAKNHEQKTAANKAYRNSESTRYKERRRERYARMTLSQKELRRQWARTCNDKVKREAFQHYGGAICHCCGETELLMLALDHIDNNGAEHRKSLTGTTRSMPLPSYIWAKKNNWPPIFQVTCFNCNWARHWNNGVCPHEARRQELLAA